MDQPVSLNEAEQSSSDLNPDTPVSQVSLAKSTGGQSFAAESVSAQQASSVVTANESVVEEKSIIEAKSIMTATSVAAAVTVEDELIEECDEEEAAIEAGDAVCEAEVKENAIALASNSSRLSTILYGSIVVTALITLAITYLKIRKTNSIKI